MVIKTHLEQAQEQGVAPWDDMVKELPNIVIYRDRYPVTVGHLLFVPKMVDVSDIGAAMSVALAWGESLKTQGDCDGYNIGINMGASAGQTVMYPHVHLIPRRAGDTEDPVGGVRGVIPGQANYKKPVYKNPTDK
jgi:diadenosine tetraphosphate (Ap4A) HIT family hydrolase